MLIMDIDIVYQKVEKTFRISDSFARKLKEKLIILKVIVSSMLINRPLGKGWLELLFLNLFFFFNETLKNQMKIMAIFCRKKKKNKQSHRIFPTISSGSLIPEEQIIGTSQGQPLSVLIFKSLRSGTL